VHIACSSEKKKNADTIILQPPSPSPTPLFLHVETCSQRHASAAAATVRPVWGDLFTYTCNSTYYLFLLSILE